MAPINYCKTIMKMNAKVAMIGVGKLGQACAEVMAESYPLVGYDVSPREPKNFPMVDTMKEAVEYGEICPRRIATADNIADLFTKSLGNQLMEKFRDQMCGYEELPNISEPRPR